MPDGIIEAHDKSPLPEQDQDTILLQLERFDRAMAAHSNWALTAKKAVDYVEGRQWTQAERADREAEGRPTLTFNKTKPLIKLVAGHQRQNRNEIRFHPGNDGSGTGETAETLTHTSKQIDEINGTRWNDAEIFMDGIITGRGYIESKLSFTNNLLGEVSERVLDPHSVYIDPDANTYDPEDWSWWFKSSWLSFDRIRVLYGAKTAAMVRNVDPSNTHSISAMSNLSSGAWEDDVTPERNFGETEWFDGNNNAASWRRGFLSSSIIDHLDTSQRLVRVVEQQHRKLVKRRFFIDTVTGDKRVIPDNWNRERIARVMEFATIQGASLTVQEMAVMRVRETHTALDRVLYDEWSPYRTFSIIPFFSWFRRGKTLGMVEDLMDPQDEINKRRNAYIEIVSRMANSGWMYPDGALDPAEEDNLLEFGSTPGVHVKWKGGPENKPEQIQPPLPPLAFERLEGQANQDLKDIANINDAALGREEKVQSGRAILAKQKQTVIAYEPEFDNFARTKEMLGRKRLELIQDFYTEERIVRVRGENGQPVEKVINQAAAAGNILNNVTVGRYGVEIDDAPLSASFLSAQLDEALKFVEIGIPIPPDILVDLSSLPRKEEVKQRIMEAQQQQQAEAEAEAAAGAGGPTLAVNNG